MKGKSMERGKKDKLDVLIVGGGMITHDLLLPSVYHLQRLGHVGSIAICALNSAPLRALRDSREIGEAFPGQSFAALPPLSDPPERMQPALFKQALGRLAPRQAVIVAVPDDFHFDVVRDCLLHDQHVLCVKPLVLRHAQALEIEELARARGLYVGVEYHKRFDRRALLARRNYRAGKFGTFVLGEAKLIEPYYYRHSNFQNWFTCDKTDPFVYVGCHYVDLVWFITGIRPVGISVSGVEGRFPNGRQGYLWANGRVRYENGALLNVSAGLGYPDGAGGGNDQGLLMYCEGDNRNGMIQHIDNDRGVRYAFLEADNAEGTRHRYVNPDFFRLVPWEQPGLRPIGYGYESVAANIETMLRIEQAAAGLAPEAALARRRELARAVDEQGILATPANSAINELVVEAARLSILSDGDWVDIRYTPAPRVAMRAKQ
jgi:predicted dehydrogenase